jgi:hypothetical protein
MEIDTKDSFSRKYQSKRQENRYKVDVTCYQHMLCKQNIPLSWQL